MRHDRYESPFCTRYASEEMQYLFSQDKKFSTFRKLWISLAKAEKALGLPITDEQIEELSSHIDDIDYEKVAVYEKQLRHDVMAHIHAYGDLCPKARPIIHLGATSCYVDDNTDIIVLRDALDLVIGKLLQVMKNLSAFALEYKGMPCLAYTHLQPAQLTTVGKRASLWLYELSLDFADLTYIRDSLVLLGSKGTTGTQASFLDLFDGDTEKVKKAEEMIIKDFGFDRCVPVSGQTYSRKHDSRVLCAIAGVAQSAYKFANDMRILQSFKEMEEPFEKNQVGSSAMPYKRNPMRSERICALARYVLCDTLNPMITASTQWFERTLDDSANKRISVAEAFLAIDAILNIYINITSGLVVYPKVVESRVMNELPFMASENIMMEAVKKGGDRQELHEKIRLHSIAAGKTVKEEGGKNDMISRIASDKAFGLSEEEILSQLIPSHYTGRAEEQTEAFVKGEILPLIEANRHKMLGGAELTV